MITSCLRKGILLIFGDNAQVSKDDRLLHLNELSPLAANVSLGESTQVFFQLFKNRV